MRAYKRNAIKIALLMGYNRQHDKESETYYYNNKDSPDIQHSQKSITEMYSDIIKLIKLIKQNKSLSESFEEHTKYIDAFVLNTSQTIPCIAYNRKTHNLMFTFVNVSGLSDMFFQSYDNPSPDKRYLEIIIDQRNYKVLSIIIMLQTSLIEILEKKQLANTKRYYLSNPNQKREVKSHED